MRLEPKLPIISAKLSRVFTKKALISYPDLLMTKPKARSGQVRKFNFLIGLVVSEWRECCHLRALSCVQFILCKVFCVQMNIFTKIAVFCLNITCKTIFILSFKIDFLKLSLGVNTGFYFEEDKKYSHLEVGAYCSEVLERAMIIKFKLTLSRWIWC